MKGTRQTARLLGIFLASVSLLPEAFSARSPGISLSEGGISSVRIAETDALSVFRLGDLRKGKNSIALLDPMLFDPGILGRRNGLLETFLDEGYNVYLLMWKSPDESIQSSLIGTEIEKALSMARTDCECTDFIAGGISLGGQRWLPYLGRLESTEDIMADSRGNRIRSVFFLGAGLDYSYPGSLYTGGRFPINIDLSRNCADAGGPCLGFIPTRHFQSGLRLRRIPLPLVPGDLSTVRMFPAIKAMTIPVAFIYGKIDGFSPEETSFSVYKAWGEEKWMQEARTEYAPYDTDNPLLWLEGSEANRIHDYDHFDLFLHPDADDEIYDELVDWMEDAERKSEN